ncbi:TadE/TadG family type IV pilus assembly protein [Rhizobium puerariae]|uniref:TadE/TadG family type IV pilus assembly protein n=1 Tax=Rhizobium puerariae TaxID=1585791 RepID=A0ABV6APP7_9HYPH
MTDETETRAKGFLARLRQLARDRRGVGAVEFALLAPLLLSLYITSFELTLGLSISKRVSRTASAVADLVSRETTVNKAFLATMKDVANSLFVPYTAHDLAIRVTGVTIDASGNPKVAWSWKDDNTVPYVVGSPVDVPSTLRTPSSFLIRSEVSVNHELLMVLPGLMSTDLRVVPIEREYFYRQRLGSSVDCSNC